MDPNENFIVRAVPWFVADGEVFVRYTFSHCGGSGRCAFCHSLAELRDIVSVLPPATRITIFKGRRLPFRGIVDSRFKNFLLSQILDGQDFLLVPLVPQQFSLSPLDLTDFAGSSHSDLATLLDEFAGEEIAAGAEPHFTTEAHEASLTFTKDGVVGAY